MGSILNRRNAVLGWVAWKLAKRKARRNISGLRSSLALVAIGSVVALVIGAASVGRSRRPSLG